MGTIEENVDRHRALICRCIRDPIVVSYINVLPEDDCSKVRQSFLASSIRGVEDLINRVHRSQASGKWTDFVNAIRNADYPFLADILENKHRSKNGEYQRRMIQIFSPALQKQLQVSDVITELYASDVITDIDKQQVHTTLTQKGNTYATIVLLDLIQCRKAPTEWYSKFLNILHRKGYGDLVRLIEPNLQHSIAPYTPGQDPLSDSMGTIEENVDKHRALICRCIRDPLVVSYINVLPEDDCSKVRQSFLASSLRGVEDLINRVHRSRASGKWTDFVNAIRNADYPFLADILENKHRSKNGEYQRRMIQIFSPEIHKQLQVSDVITELYASDVITDIDKQQVLTTLTQKGNTYATMVLLDLIQCRKAPTEWYSKFLKILHRKGYYELVRAIEPNLQHSTAPYTPGQELPPDDEDDYGGACGVTQEHVMTDYQDARSKKFATLAVPQHDRIPDMQASMRAMKLHSQKRPIIPKPAIPPKSVSQNNAISLKQSQESEPVIRKTSAQQREKVSVKSTSSSNQAHQGSTRYVLGPRSCKSVQAERYQGEMRVDIRKWINGIPTKEGVSLHVAQWNNLVESMKHIDKALSKGDKCVRQLGNTAVCLITDDGQGIELYKIDPKTGAKKSISLTIEEYTALKGHTSKIGKTLA